VPENPIHISLIQTNLAWENPEENLEHIQTLLPAKNETNWVVLPETFATGFSLKPESANHADQTIALMAKLAGEKNYVISGSILVTANSGKLENRFYFFFPNGEINWYAKRHAFSLAGEHHVSYKEERNASLIDIKRLENRPAGLLRFAFPCLEQIQRRL
jgi:omega-amidase